MPPAPRVTDTVTSEAHSSGSHYVSNPGKWALKGLVFDAVSSRDVENHPQFSCLDSVNVAFQLCSRRPGFTTTEENAFHCGYKRHFRGNNLDLKSQENRNNDNSTVRSHGSVWEKGDIKKARHKRNSSSREFSGQVQRFRQK